MADDHRAFIVLAADHGVEIVVQAQHIDLPLEIGIVALGLGRDHIGQAQHGVVGCLAKLFQLLDVFVLGAAHLAIFGMTFATAMDQHFGGHEKADLSELARQFTRMSTGGFAKDRAEQQNKGE